VIGCQLKIAGPPFPGAYHAPDSGFWLNFIIPVTKKLRAGRPTQDHPFPLSGDSVAITEKAPLKLRLNGAPAFSTTLITDY
jgi:hypothetical protein